MIPLTKLRLVAQDEINLMSKAWSSLILAIALLMAVGLAQTSAGHAILRNAGLSKPSPIYTALSFNRPQSLPEQLPSKRAAVSVSFNIQNMSAVTRSYRWSVTIVRNGRSDQRDAGSVNVRSGATATLTRLLSVACIGGQMRFVVQLAKPAESIDFLTACTQREGRAG